MFHVKPVLYKNHIQKQQLHFVNFPDRVTFRIFPWKSQNFPILAEIPYITWWFRISQILWPTWVNHM